MIDAKMQTMLDLIRSEGGRMAQEDKRLDPYSDDRGRETDTFNRCVNAGLVKAWTCSLTDSGTVELVN